MRHLNLAARLLLEMVALGALAYWGLHTGESRLAQLLLGVGAPLAAVMLWGTFGAPRAPVRLSAPARLALQTVIFAAAALAWAGAEGAVAASVLAGAVVANTALMMAWGQQLHDPSRP